MSDLLICAAVVAYMGASVCHTAGQSRDRHQFIRARRQDFLGLALIAAALYLAWRAGGAGA